ncbi:MAG: AsmA family protein [Phyllobacterium sp.]
MGRIFVAVGGLLVLVLTVALVAPYFIDWTGYRADFEREAGKVLGRPVVVAGEASARLLPFPSVTFTDVRVGEEGSDPVMTVDRFSMDAELAPFMSGEVLIFDMRLERPHARINIDESGAVDWALRPNTPFNPSQISLENLSISNGSIEINDRATGRMRQIKDLNATVSATSLAGPWRVDGEMDFNGEQVGLSASTGELKEDGRLNLRLRITPENLPVVFETDGGVVVEAGKPVYSGQIGLRSAASKESKKPAEVMREGADGLIELVPQEQHLLSELQITGRFEATSAGLDVPEFRMEQGPKDDPYIVNGNALFDFGQTPRFEIVADGQQVLLDAGGDGNEQGAGAAIPFAERIDVVRDLLDRIPVPTIPGTIDLTLPAVVAGDTTIRSVRINAEPGEGNWLVRQLTADLPGRTRVEASGTLFIGEDFGFDGDLLLASRQPSGFAAWLTQDVDEAIRRLPAAGFSGRVSLRDDEQRIDNLELSLGGTSLKGNFTRTSHGDALPFMKLSLEGGALDADGLESLVSLLANDAGAPRLEDHDLDVSLKAGPVSHDGLTAGSVDTAFRLRDGQFDIDRLMIGDIAGATLTATGTAKPFSVDPTGSFDVTLLSEDMSSFLSVMAKQFPQLRLFRALSDRAEQYPGLFADSQLNIFGAAVNAPEQPREFSFSASGQTGGMDIGLSGVAKGDIGNAAPLEINVAATAKAAKGEKLLALLGVPVLPLGLVGELGGNLEMKGTLDGGLQTQLKLNAPDAQALLDGSFTMKGDVLAGIGRASLKAADLEPFLAATGYGLSQFGMGIPADVSTSFQIEEGRISLPDFSGKLDGTAIAAKLNVGTENAVPDIRGEAKVESFDLASSVAFMLGPDAVVQSGREWSTTEFAKAPAFPLTANVVVSADKAFAGTFGRIEGFKGKFTKTADTIRMDDLSGKIFGGKLGGVVELRNSNGTALSQAQVKIEGADLATLYSTDDELTPLTGKVNLAISLNAAGANVASLMASAAGSGVLTSNEITLNGFNPTALPGMIKATDMAGAEVSAAQLEDIVDQNLGEGSLTAGPIEIAFTLAGGTGRVPAFNLPSDAASFSSELRFNLPDRSISSQGTFMFHAGRESIAGAEPVVGVSIDGPYRNPTVTIDRQPLVQFLAQRALEREQQRVETMQIAFVEKQRLRREARLYQARDDERARIAEEKRLQEEARLEAERQAQKLKMEEEAAIRAMQEKAREEADEAVPPNSALGSSPLEKNLTVDDFLKSLTIPAPQ